MQVRSMPRAGAIALIAVLIGVVGCEGYEADEAAGPGTEAPSDTPPGDRERSEGIDRHPGHDPTLREDPDCFGLDPADDDRGAIVCGYVEVPLHHDQPEGDTIELAVAVLPGSAPEAHDRPLLMLGGGPGEALVEPLLTDPLIREAFDLGPELIVVDQRGVGASDPALDCPQVAEPLGEGVTPEAQLDAYVTELLDCRDRLADEGIDLGAFNHLANASDVDVVRRSLGYDRIDLRGTSYGAQAALLATQARPDTIDRLILSSPVDPTRNWVELAPAGIQRAVDDVAAACEQDKDCAEAFGDVRALIDETVDRLEDAPEQLTVELPESEPVTLTYTPAQFLGGLSLLFYLPDGVGTLPAFSAAAAEGNLRPLAELSVALEQQLVGAVSVGMQYSMLCSGEGAHVTEQGLRAATDPGPLEEHWLPNNVIAGDRMVEVCDGWDVDAVYDPAEIVIDHAVPTLIVTGEFDHVTPPTFGRTIADQLDASILIEVPAAGHAPLEVLGACGRRIAVAFLREPTVRPDDTCATQRELSFVPGFGLEAG